MISVALNETVSLQMLSADGREDLYPVFYIYDSAGYLIAEIDGDHIADGLYYGEWTPDVEGYYASMGIFFTDTGRTVDAGYEHAAETIDVNSIKANILRILGPPARKHRGGPTELRRGWQYDLLPGPVLQLQEQRSSQRNNRRHVCVWRHL